MANQNDNAQSAKSQCDMIAAWLERGFSITSLEALQRFGCMRLASRIHDLRERGMNIKACKITTCTGKRVCEYVLAK
jgi:hypothetical protein